MEETQGERHLLAAILLRAIKDLITFSQSSDSLHRAIASEARCWLFEEDEEEHHLTSFRNICKLMDLDTEKVRTQVLVLRENTCTALIGGRHEG